MKILVIDDEPAIRYAVARILRSGGYDVVLADDGEHGLALFRKEPPSLVICDLIMPRIDGLETIAQIRQEAPGVKIIAISGGSGGDAAINADGLAAALQNGADEVIVKPFHPQDLLERVSGALMG